MQIITSTCYKIFNANLKNTFIRNLITGRTIVPIKGNDVISVHGKDCKKLLQGMITNDVALLDGNLVSCIYSMVLNVQGRILFDLFLHKHENGYLMECNASIKDELVSYLNRYKLRSKVFFESRDDLKVYVSFHSDLFEHFVVDPRLPKLGYRSLSSKNYLENDFDDISCYTNLRYQLGISEGAEVINGIPLEHNIALLNGVSFTKGCYIGQELVARAHHTGVIRKRIVPLLLSNQHCLLNGNTVCIDGDFQVGKLLGISGKNAIGLLRLKETFDDKNKLCIKGSDVSVIAFKPDWWPENMTYK